MKKRFTLITFLSVMVLAVMAQNPVTYIVKLTDKQSTAYSIERPAAFLSEKAIERRARFGVDITMRDLPVSPEYVKEIHQRGYRITNRIKWLNTLIVEGTEAKEVLENLPFVKSVIMVEKSGHDRKKPFFEAEAYGVKPPLFTAKQSRDNNEYDYGEGYNQIEMLNGHVVHNAGFDGEGMEIAVLDAGFSQADDLEAFDSLWVNNQILGTRNYVNTEDVFSPSISSHGMMVLSTMGGNLPGQLVGTAPKAKYWLVRTEDASDEYLLEEYYWVDGAEFADSAGVDIINSSLGYTDGFNDPANNHTYEDMNGDTTPVTIGADIAASVGILVVNSAGNSGQSSWFYIGGPADGDSVLAVGAVDGAGNYVAFSSKGPSYDGRVKPNVAAKGSSATVASSWGGITYANGTSFSSPIMAGMVASIWQANPSMSNMDLIEIIQEHGNQASEPDSLLGYGIPDFGAMLDIIGTHNVTTDKLEQVTIWPNPFSEKVVVEAPVLISSVILYDIAGNIVAEKASEGNRIVSLEGLNHLPQGVYILKIQAPNAYSVRKVVKR